MQVQGIGPASARLLHSFRDVARFYQIQKHKEHPVQLRNAEMCCEYIRPLFSDPKREEFYMIAMNDDYVPLKEIYIASGIPNRVQFDTHKLLRDAVASQCTCVVLAHNHPSGLAAASNADLLATQAIILALGQVGIDVLDHVILTPTNWFSMAEHGRVPQYNPGTGQLLFAARATWPMEAEKPKQIKRGMRRKHKANPACPAGARQQGLP